MKAEIEKIIHRCAYKHTSKPAIRGKAASGDGDYHSECGHPKWFMSQDEATEEPYCEKCHWETRERWYQEKLDDKEITIGVLDRAVEVREEMETELMAKLAMMKSELEVIDTAMSQAAFPLKKTEDVEYFSRAERIAEMQVMYHETMQRWDQAEVALSTAQAKLAVLTEIVKVVAAEGQPLPDALKDEHIVLQEITAGMVRQAREALSGVPKVLWVGGAELCHWGTPEEPFTRLFKLWIAGHIGRNKQQVKVIVLAEGEE